MMGCSGLLILVFVLNVAHCWGILGGGQTLEITRNVTGVLGEDVYLSCRYLGESKILNAEWKRHIKSEMKSKRVAGFFNGRAFSRADFSEPESLTNLTVRMAVSSVDVEGEYICEFASEEEDFFDKVFVTVTARPDVHVLVETDSVNGSHVQSVSCWAVGGRPLPLISWLVGDRAPQGAPYTLTQSQTLHPNGTSTLSSVLRFPTHLQDQDTVTCVVQHPTLPEPERTTVAVETYARPDVSVKAEMLRRGGSDFWVVSCVSSGGRPAADIVLALSADEELQTEDTADSDMQIRSVMLDVLACEGCDVTCVFDHPKFTQNVSRVLTLPFIDFEEVKLLSSDQRSDVEFVEFLEGQSDAVIVLDVTANVPYYNITCKKDDGPLPDGVETVDGGLVIRGPVEQQHGGRYECCFAYRSRNTSLEFNVTVIPPVIQPVPPTIQVGVRTEDGRRVMECSASDAVPAANVSWLLPEGVSGVSWFNLTSHNGSHSVRGVFLLPACSPWELTAECVINHPAFEEPENRSITLPLCDRVNVTLNSSREWRDGVDYTTVDCCADAVAPAATITWHVGNASVPSHTEVRAGGLASTCSSARFVSSLYSGQSLTCTVQHASLQAPETTTIHIPARKAPELRASVVRQQDSPLWLAVCDCRGEEGADGGGGVGVDLAWVLPENAKGQTSLHSESEGRILNTRLTYEFPLALHEGQDLTCVHHLQHGGTETKTVHVPRYYMSALRVLNFTTPLQSRSAGEPAAHRLTLQEHRHDQRVLLSVEGNVPEYVLDCRRSDGSSVQMDGAAMVFQSELTLQDGGLISCSASFYHHRAHVNILVEVMSHDKLLALVSMICMSSASAIVLVSAVVLWTCWKRTNRPQYNKQQECLSALTSLMQDPGSPEVKPSSPPSNDQTTNYSIVIDVKSTV